MNIDAYREQIKLELTGGLLELEIDDAALDKIISTSFREIQRYIDTTKIVTLRYSPCIDVSEYNINVVTNVYRPYAFDGDSKFSYDNGYVVDPMYATQWQMLAGVGNLNYFQDASYNYMSWSTLQQIRNTMSTDLAFKFDRDSNKLYINISTGIPEMITIEYVPVYKDVSDVVSDFWIDVIMKHAIARTKIIVGRIRSRYTQSNALWLQDGDTMLSEGNAELAQIRTDLKASTQLVYPID